MKFRLVAILLVTLLAIRAAGSEPDLKPPQVTVNFVYPPSPLVQHGTTQLVYEMIITNYVPIAYTLESISVEYPNTKLFFTGESLRRMMRFAGEPASAIPGLKIDGGRTAVVFLMLHFGNPSQVPASLGHTVTLRSPDGTDHALTVKPLQVVERAPIIVEAPLRGSDWMAGDSVHNGPDAAHRRAVLFAGGEPYIAQRYAIDWIRYRIVNGVATTWSGLEDRNSSYFCYGEPIYSMTSGTVTEVLDGIPENVPHSGKMAIDVNFRNAGGITS